MDLVSPSFGLMFWMVLIFSITLLILRRYAWKPILAALRSRDKSIEDALHAAEKAKQEMAKLQLDNEKILAEARLERDKQIKEARQLKDKIIDDAKIMAQQEAQKIVEAARSAIENEKKAALQDIHNQVSELSILVAEKILKEKLAGVADQTNYIDKLLKDFKLN